MSPGAASRPDIDRGVGRRPGPAGGRQPHAGGTGRATGGSSSRSFPAVNCRAQPDWPVSIRVCGFLDTPNTWKDLTSGGMTFGSWMQEAAGHHPGAVRRGMRIPARSSPIAARSCITAARGRRSRSCGPGSVVVANISEQEHWGRELQKRRHRSRAGIAGDGGGCCGHRCRPSAVRCRQRDRHIRRPRRQLHQVVVGASAVSVSCASARGSRGRRPGRPARTPASTHSDSVAAAACGRSGRAARRAGRSRGSCRACGRSRRPGGPSGSSACPGRPARSGPRSRAAGTYGRPPAPAGARCLWRAGLPGAGRSVRRRAGRRTGAAAAGGSPRLRGWRSRSAG
jgi:hypothetical protein